ncbi:hypothetical protein EIP91_010412, partial [Steccherinum ochraceum]
DSHKTDASSAPLKGQPVSGGRRDAVASKGEGSFGGKDLHQVGAKAPVSDGRRGAVSGTLVPPEKE